MDVSLKKGLYYIGYYALAIIVVLVSVAFMVAMTLNSVPIYQQVVYYVWSIILIFTVMFDVYATKIGNLKYISGLAFYGLTFLCIAMGIIVYAANSFNGVAMLINSPLFSIAIGFSACLSVLSIIMFWQGQNIVELKSIIKKSR